MEYIVTGQEMKSCDNRTIEYYKIPSMVLMERAALGFFHEFMNYFQEEIHAASTVSNGSFTVGIICGTGNNGGDGLVVARLLYEKQIPVKVVMVGEQSRLSTDCGHQLEILNQYQLPVTWITSLEKIHQLRELDRCNVLIDAVFGVGLSREVTGIYKNVLEYINNHPGKVAAVDVPSGIHSDNGQILGTAVKADLTVTFAFKKAGLVFYPGAEYAGKVVVKDIGITQESFNGIFPKLFTLDFEDIKKMLPKRMAYSHKGSYGKVTLFVGSEGMAGAACLAAKAAYCTGCGLVQVVTPKSNRLVLQTVLPEAIVTTYTKENLDENFIEKAVQWADVVGIGCGLGQSEEACFITEYVLKNVSKPLIVDGDGLNILAKNPELLKGHVQPLILTPHLLEMSRLCNISVSEIQNNLVETAVEFSKDYDVCCVLKDARTIVANGDTSVYVNVTGNHGMATGGSGDVLAGMICGLAAQGMTKQDAAIAAVYLHGNAGDRAKARLGAEKMLAGNIIEHIMDRDLYERE